jgi:hypothetical protein
LGTSELATAGVVERATVEANWLATNVPKESAVPKECDDTGGREREEDKADDWADDDVDIPMTSLPLVADERFAL